MADGQVVFEITGDPKGINQTVKQVTSNIQSESRKWDQAAGDATGNIEKSFANMAGKIVGSLTAAGIGAILLNWGKAAVEAASDLAEVQNVVDTVFGDGARQIEAWAKSAGQQFGLTETQAKKFTSTLGAMMKSSGIAGNEIVNMSTSLAGLAADMASFYNLDFETAFEKIRSGISGETEPLKQLGINMSVANLEAFALAQGLEKTFSQMTQGEQTMLRYQYIMQATADAQGDFAKTADGFANSQRRIQTALDTISTVAGGFLLNTIEPLISGFATFLGQLTQKPESTVLDDFNEIEIDTAGKMAALDETYEKAQAIIDLIDEISKQTVTLNTGATVTFEELFKDLGNIEANGGDVRGYLASLGLDVDEIINKYNVWKESTRQLTSLVPSLTSVINSETGAIEGGTEALQKNLDEWRANEEKKLAWAAYYAKARALEEKKAQMWSYEFDYGAAKKLVENQRAAMLKAYKDIGFDENGNVNLANVKVSDYSSAMKDDIAKYNRLMDNFNSKAMELSRQRVYYAEAEEEVIAGEEKLVEEYGRLTEAETDASEAAQEYGNKSAEAWKDSLKGAENAKDALKVVADYYKGVRDSTAQAVNSVVKGFEKVGMAGDDLRTQSNKLAGEETEALNKYAAVWSKYGSDNASLKAMAANWDNLTKEEQAAYEALVKVRNAQKEVNDSLNQYKPEAMQANLQSQINFMTEYLNNLDRAKEMGLSDELLASLSDGSKESAEYLAGLVEGGPEAAKAVDDLYGKVQEKKKAFTDALTDQKLTVDETYSGMVEAAKEAMEGLDMGDEAAAAMGATVQGIAAGIRDNVSEVSSAMDALISELNRLNTFGFTYGYSDGSFLLELDGEHETGLDYVPFDGYLAGLHEGEGILTAEENRIWQRFKNGQASTGNVDYDALGGVMRDNVKAGGNVYLDGRTVGHVISDAQGRSFRALQRSGWQG